MGPAPHTPALAWMRRLALIAAVGTTLLAGLPAHAASGLFANLAGNWSGTGSIRAANGASEPIRCRARYETSDGDNTLTQTLRCASDSFRFDVESSVTYNAAAGVLKGSWREKANDVGGRVTGRADSGRIQARVQGNAFAAAIEVVTRGSQQSVVIRPENTDITEVSVELHKG